MAGGLRAAPILRLFAGGLLAASLLVSAEASAADQCSTLRAQLASLGKASSAGENAVELKKLQTQALWGGCRPGGKGFMVAIRRPDCPQLLARIAALRNGGGSDRNAAKRASISRSLERSGCNGQRSASANKQAAPVNSRGQPSFGRYRTLCVRLCDGYYFPISHTGSRSQFEIDEAACKSMYFGKEAELFVHRTGDGIDDAVSLKREAYTEISSAFAYRSRYDRACAAQIREGLTGLAKVMPPPKIAARTTGVTAKEAVSIPLPLSRARSSEDPETLANRAGNFRVTPHREIEVADGVPTRKIGPAYYYKPVTRIVFAGKPLDGPGLFSGFQLIGSLQAAENHELGAAKARVQ